MKIGSVLALTAAMLLAGCGVKEEMSQKMDDSLDQIKRTNEIVKQQCVALTFESLLKPEFAKVLSPVPFDLMPFAKKFGECTSADDITEVMYLWMKKLNEYKLDTETSKPSDADIEAFNNEKTHVLTAMKAVAGLLPEDKIDQIIAKQIDGEGRYQETGLEILAMRVEFLKDAMLKASLLSKPINNLGKLNKAIEYANSIEKIERLPYARPVGPKGEALTSPVKYTISGYMGPYEALNTEHSLAPDTALWQWKLIRDSAGTCFGDKSTPALCPAVGVQEKAAAKAQASQAMSYVTSKIVGWGEK